LLLVGTSASVSALGGAHCTWGPSYWCANIPQASECSATKHCIKAVWEKQKVADDDDDVCKICKEMVTEARDQLLSNETQTELREVFDGSCDLIPIGMIANECKKLADEFVVELVETLASEMNPVSVCTVAGLCNSARIDKLLAAQPKASNLTIGGDCPICREGANQVKQQLTITDKNQMEDKFLEICGYFGSFSEACRAGVLEEYENIYTWLTQSFDDSVCDVAGVCSPVYLNVPPTQLKQGGDIQCEFCEKVIQHWVDVYASNSSLEEFKMILDSICERVDKKNAAHCKHIVDDYYIPAFQFIKNEINPHTVCSLVGLCGSGGFMKVSPKTAITTLLVSHNVEMMPLQPAIKITGQEKFQANWMHSPSGPASLNGGLYVPSSVAMTEKPTCVLCEFVLHQLQTFLKDGQTEEEIKAAVHGVCNVMPQVLRDECSKFVDKYEPAIVELLVREVDPSQLCPLLKLCDKQGALQSALMPQGYASLMKDSNCEMCQFALTEVFSVLKDKDNQDMVKNVLESICYRLPNSIEAECEDFVEKYTNTAIDMIVNGLTPDEICKAMDVCARHGQSSPAPLPEDKDSGCIICEYVITTLDGMIEDKTNEKQIKAALESLCSYLPSSVSKECNSFVDTYTDMIIEMLTHDITPEQICTNLGLCATVGNVVQHIQHKIILDPLSASPYCTLCEYAIQELDNMLEDKSNEEEIKQSLDILCNQLSLPVKKQCIKMVGEYTDQIIDLFIKEYTPEMVCTELSLCVNNDINSNAIPALSGPVQIIDIPRITPQPKPVGLVKSVGGVPCVMCEFAMKVLDEHLEDPSSIDQVERMVQFLCSYLPGSVADNCEALVDEYGERMVKAIVEDEMEPEQICTQVLGVCSSSPAIATTTAAPGLAGGKKCAWGPAYWCKTPFHAEICGVTQHCQDKVWGKGGL